MANTYDNTKQLATCTYIYIAIALDIPRRYGWNSHVARLACLLTKVLARRLFKFIS